MTVGRFNTFPGCISLPAMLSNVTFRGGASTSYILHGEDDSRVVTCLLAAGYTVPTADPTDGSKWAVGALFIKLNAGTAETSLYTNTGTQASPAFTASVQTKANLLALLGSLSHTHVFTGTAGSTDGTVATDAADPTVNGTRLYLGIDRGKTIAGVFVSENAGAATSDFETVAGLSVPVVHNAVDEATLTIKDSASALTLGSQLYVKPIGGPNRWKGQIGALAAMSRGFVNGTVNSSTPTDTWEIEHFIESEYRRLALESGRLLSAADIPNLAAIGGVPAKNSDPILESVNGATDARNQLNWAAASVVAMKWTDIIPMGYDHAKDLRIVFKIAKGTNTDTTNEIVGAIYFDDGAAVAFTTGALNWTAETTVVVAIPAASVPADVTQYTITLTPGAHNNDAVYLRHLAAEFPLTHNGIPIYVDYDAATATSRLLINNPLGVDIYVRSATGRFLKLTHSATAAADGEPVTYDHDAGGGATEVLLYNNDDEVDPTDATCTVGNQLGFWNIEGVYLAPVFINQTTSKFVIANPDGLAETDVPVITLAGNRMFSVHTETIDVQVPAYFDDDAAPASQRVLANLTGATLAIPLDTAQYPFGKTPVGTNAATVLIS